MNEYDSNRIYDLIKTIGFVKTSTRTEADCFLINTCHIRDKSTEKIYHEILIQNLVPLSHYDLEENKSLLLENNFENLNSISWDKGCYVGQEITARMKYRSLLKKRIYCLKAKEGSASVGEYIKDDESDYGKIISVVNNSILAMLKIELAERKINAQKKIKTNEGLVLEFIL